ncbi:MAG: hypothetical protein ABIH18_00110 [Candidatus Omnitrophota bacterium]
MQKELLISTKIHIDSKDIYKIKPLINSYSYGDFRKYRVLSINDQSNYLFNQILDIAKTPDNCIFVCSDKKNIRGFAVLKYLEWDSKHFDQDMRQITYLITKEDYSEAIKIKSSLLKAILKYNKKIDNAHLSCKIDTLDITSIHVLESFGFKLMDTIITWVFKPVINFPKYKNIYKVRDFQEKDLEELMDLAKHRFSMNRFHLDPNIPNDKADKMYAEWVKNYCLNSAKGNTKVKVAENKNGVAGFLGYRLNEGIKKTTGHRIIGQGLMAIKPSAKGASINLINTTIKDVILNYDFAEFDGLITNHEAIKIYQAFNFEIIRSKHTFHFLRE